MSTKTLLIVFIDLLIFGVLVFLAFGNVKGFLKALYYLIYPNIASIVKKDYDNDFSYTHRLLFVLAVLCVLVVLEIRLFY